MSGIRKELLEIQEYYMTKSQTVDAIIAVFADFIEKNSSDKKLLEKLNASR